jgi:cell division protein FtsQ
LILSISGAVAWGARKYVKTTPRFAVTDVVVTGAHRRSTDDVVAASGMQKGANVFTIDLERARHKLVQDPWILDATLARRLPGTIYVQVVERKAAAIVALGDTYLATREGEIFKRVEIGDPIDFPIITGLSVRQLADDREGCARIVRRSLDLATEYERTSLASRAPLQEIHVADDGSTTLVVGKSAVLVHMGEPPFRKKIDQAARVFAELDRRGAKPDAIMLDNEGRPDRVVVRMR